MEEKKRDPFKPWWNAWFLTFNTNQSNPKLVYPLDTLWNYITNHISQFTIPVPGVKILKVKKEHAVEQGEKRHRYHLHAFLAIRSTGLLNLDYEKIKDFMEEQLRQVKGFKSIAFRHTIIRGYNSAENAREYLRKAPITPTKGKSKFAIIRNR
jgi:hypothetical protein